MNQSSDSEKEMTIANIYGRYYHDLYYYFLSYTSDTMQAEDMVQDLFVKVLGLDIIVEETSKSMLFVIARNMIVDHARHKAIVRNRSNMLRAESLEADSSMMQRIEAVDLLGLVQKTLERMSATRAQVYTRFRHEGYTIKEIAQEMNLSTRTVENHIYHSTKAVRDDLRKAM